MTADETQKDTCTYQVGGYLEGRRACGKSAAVRCEFGDLENYPEYINYCIQHFQRAYDYIARDENRLFTLGQHSGHSPSSLLD